MKPSRLGFRRAVRPAIVLAFALSVASCAGDTQEGVQLLRLPGSSHPTGSENGHLVIEDGCLRLHDERGSDKSLIFAGHLDVRVENDELVVDGVPLGKVGPAGVMVTLPGRDGPVAYHDSEVTGPIDRTCNQTDPWEVTEIRVRLSGDS